MDVMVSVGTGELVFPPAPGLFPPQVCLVGCPTDSSALGNHEHLVMAPCWEAGWEGVNGWVIPKSHTEGAEVWLCNGWKGQA